jgi:DNA-binding MarR family transcriptional regulator
VPDPRWLTDEEQDAWRQLAGVFTRLPAVLDTQLQRDAGLTHFGYWVLAMLSEAPGRALRMSELAARSNSSLSRLSHGVTRLVAQGWVRRERSPDDGRGAVAVLTDAGWDKLVAAAPSHVEAVRQLVFDALRPEQVPVLAELGRLLLAKVDEATAAPRTP